MNTEDHILLNIKELKTFFYTHKGVIKAVDGVNLSLKEHEKLGIVGESGSGKSVTALSVLRLVPQPPGRILSGEILFQNKDTLKLSNDEIRHLRCSQIAMIFQDPLSSLNPVLPIGKQIAEAMKERYPEMEKNEIKEKVIKILQSVGIAEASEKLDKYPHQFSGGMRQRIMIAIAISREPRILIADEPTTSLDVTTQAQVLDLIEDMVEKKGSSLILISHDIGVIAETCDKIAVMYAGRVMEYGDIRDVFKKPIHPYTCALLNSIPRMDLDIVKLEAIPGKVPDLIAPPNGCRFNPRCKHAREECQRKVPELRETDKEHLVACHLF